MRVPYPTHIRMQYATLFATAVAVIQLVQGTNGFFVLCCFFFIVVATYAFNTAGGLVYPSGAYIFWYSTLAAIVSWVVKIFLGEAADSNLRMPNLTVSIYLGTIVSLAVAVTLSKRFTPKKPLLGNFLTEENSGSAAIACAVVGAALELASWVVKRQPGDLLSILLQLNLFPILAIVIGASYEIKKSGGTRSINAAVVLAGVSMFVDGLAGFSKEGLFEPILAYIATCGVMRYQFRWKQVCLGALGFYLLVQYGIPYSQYGRTFRAEGDASFALLESNLSSGYELLRDPQALRLIYETEAEDIRLEQLALSQQGSYFNSDQGLFERLTMLLPDDNLTVATEEGRSQYGFEPLYYEFENIVPHFIWPDKPAYGFGNLYAHEAGMLAEDDLTTGVSFSPGGAAYHMAKWTGVLLIAPLVFFFTFFCLDTLCGDARHSPWALVVVAVFAHVAPEGMLASPIHVVTYLGPGLAGIAYICAYLMPIIGALIIGPQQKKVVVIEDPVIGAFRPKQV